MRKYAEIAYRWRHMYALYTMLKFESYVDTWHVWLDEQSTYIVNIGCLGDSGGIYTQLNFLVVSYGRLHLIRGLSNVAAKCPRITQDVWLTLCLRHIHRDVWLKKKKRERHHSLALALTLTLTLRLSPNHRATSHCCQTAVHCTVFNTPTHQYYTRASQDHPRTIR